MPSATNEIVSPRTSTSTNLAEESTEATFWPSTLNSPGATTIERPAVRIVAVSAEKVDERYHESDRVITERPLTSVPPADEPEPNTKAMLPRSVTNPSMSVASSANLFNITASMREGKDIRHPLYPP